MCGIAGYWAKSGVRPSRQIVERMCGTLVHRGPDAFGCWLDDHVALGHRRLSIIDLSGGDQPMGNEDGSIQVVFNGEIYNYVELKGELLKKGHRFRTDSDTEVLVHLYEEVGVRMPEYLNGMFAFAIWDSRRQELFLARDRFGKKPLYYASTLDGMRFSFASELKAFTCLPNFSRELDPEAVADFLCLSYVPDPRSIYKCIRKLKGGHSLTVRPNGMREQRYWEPQFRTTHSTNFDATVEQLGSIAQDAVTRRMMSDVPLGAFLSGGVDSSAVAAFMSKSAAEVKTFSIGFADKAFNELPYARQVAERYRTSHYEEVVTPSVHEMLDTLITHYDEPFADPSAIPMLYLARMTRRHVTVALSGDGADEVFGGYDRYRWNIHQQRLRSLLPNWFRRSVIRFGAQHYPSFEYMPRVFRAKATLNFLSKELGDAYFTHMSMFRDDDIGGIVSPELAANMGGYSPRADFYSRFRAYEHLSPLQQMQAVDLETYLPGDILVKVDRATMAYSLEARCPWLDYRLTELAAQLPSSFHLRQDVGKYLFKKVVGPLLPEGLLTRPKMGFAVPIGSWFQSSLKPTFESLVFRPEMDRYVSPRAVRHLWEQHQSGFRNHHRKLWNIMMLAAWDARHLDGRAVDYAPAAIAAH